MPDDDEAAYGRFRETVDMTARELEKWLSTGESRSVGQKRGDDEATGHAGGRRIVDILRTQRGDLSTDDYAHMRGRRLREAPRGAAAARRHRQDRVAILADELGTRPEEVLDPGRSAR